MRVVAPPRPRGWREPRKSLAGL